MRMKIGAELPAGYEVTHEDLAQSAGALIAHALLPIFQENLREEIAKANVEGILTEIAYLFDEGEIELGGKTTAHVSPLSMTLRLFCRVLPDS